MCVFQGTGKDLQGHSNNRARPEAGLHPKMQSERHWQSSAVASSIHMYSVTLLLFINYI